MRAGFWSGGGAWMVLLTAAIGLISFIPLLGASALDGGGLLPLSTTVGQLWMNVGYAWHQVGSGFVGASDPFTTVLALLGSATFWAPSYSIVLVYLAALPLAALGAWWCATRLSERAWPPAVAALLWAVAPPFLSSLDTGHFGAVIAHILLPWLVLAGLAAVRSWAASAGAALLLAVVVAGSPSLAPALAVALVVLIVVRPRGTHRLVPIAVPTVVLFAPLIWAQAHRGNLLALFADPGAPSSVKVPSGWSLAIGSPDAGLGGWDAVASVFGLSALPGPLVAVILFAPMAILALVAVFLPGSRRAIPSLGLAFLGFVSAVAATHLETTVVGSGVTTVWAGGALSLFWLGLVGAVVAALDSFRGRVALPGLIVAVASLLAVAPLLAAPIAGTLTVKASDGELLPEYVTAEATTHPGVGTIELRPQSDGSLVATLHRGVGTTLDDQATLASTRSTMSSAEKQIATVAGNLASRSGFDTAASLTSLHVEFVLLAHGTDDGAAALEQRASAALDGNRTLVPIGDTSQGLLWRYAALPATAATHAEPNPLIRNGILGVQALVFFVTLLLAIPTGRRRRHARDRNAEESGASLGEADDE